MSFHNSIFISAIDFNRSASPSNRGVTQPNQVVALFAIKQLLNCSIVPYLFAKLDPRCGTTRLALDGGVSSSQQENLLLQVEESAKQTKKKPETISANDMLLLHSTTARFIPKARIYASFQNKMTVSDFSKLINRVSYSLQDLQITGGFQSDDENSTKKNTTAANSSIKSSPFHSLASCRCLRHLEVNFFPSDSMLKNDWKSPQDAIKNVGLGDLLCSSGVLINLESLSIEAYDSFRTQGSMRRKYLDCTNAIWCDVLAKLSKSSSLRELGLSGEVLEIGRALRALVTGHDRSDDIDDDRNDIKFNTSLRKLKILSWSKDDSALDCADAESTLSTLQCFRNLQFLHLEMPLCFKSDSSSSPSSLVEKYISTFPLSIENLFLGSSSQKCDFSPQFLVALSEHFSRGNLRDFEHRHGTYTFEALNTFCKNLSHSLSNFETFFLHF